MMNRVVAGWAIVCVSILGGPVLAVEPVELRVMSFNVRYSYGGADERRTENNWTDAVHPRRELAIRVIHDHRPDLLGVQEARALQVDDLRAALPEMSFCGVGRDDGESGGEFSCILYRDDRFERVDAGSFWLSATPETPGTTFATAPGAVPRIASWVVLEDRHGGGRLFVLNTHWDHADAAARRQSAQLIRERLPKLADELPTIVMGDFNATEDAAEMRTMFSGRDDATAAFLRDSYRAVHPKRRPDEVTYHDFDGSTAGSRIDFILHTDSFMPLSAEIVRTSYDGRWPSDHYPVTTTLQLHRQP